MLRPSMCLSLLREARTDTDARMVAVDLLVQCGYSDDRIRRTFRPYFPIAVRLAANDLRAEFERRLEVVNANARQRLIRMGEVIAAVREALEERGFGWRNGGWPTASSYGYSWQTSCVTVVRDDVSELRFEHQAIRVVLGRYSQRSAAWGISGNSDRATRPETVARIRRDAAQYSRESYDAAFSTDVARCLVSDHEYKVPV